MTIKNARIDYTNNVTELIILKLLIILSNKTGIIHIIVEEVCRYLVKLIDMYSLGI
ncbi:hypothetical protein [Caldisalinibacter kiritimatiensis]|uniref:Uncharacterized protein n=1 Tax=Caldisalinibacter kiritimatiensis TaxID=1304284 RepID=R1CBW7_9FIRM|nr:hypothetical protein [Caldisalinibacter kiritimatiensis]EOC99804.1 hypothetical protein L21TH_2109 [Caldisalinibacter kiritimatiensis]